MKILVIKRTLNIVFLFISTVVFCQTPNQQAKTLFGYLKAKKYEKIPPLFTDYALEKNPIYSGYKESCINNFKKELDTIGNIKKLIKIDEQEAGCKKDIALTVQFKKKKKIVYIRFNQKEQIETFYLTPYKETPFFELKGYKGFSEVTDLTTAIKTNDGLLLGANIAFGDTEKQKSPIVIMMQLYNDRDFTTLQQKPYRDLAQGLAQKGVVSLRVDCRYFTYESEIKSDAKFMEISEIKVNDLISSIKHLKQFTFIDTTKIFIVGYYTSAEITMLKAKYPMLKGVVSITPPGNELKKDVSKLINEPNFKLLYLGTSNNTNDFKTYLKLPQQNPKYILHANLDYLLLEDNAGTNSKPRHIPQYVIDDVVEFITK